MAFKLTFLLVGLIFIVMYFAQDREPVTAARQPEPTASTQEATLPEPEQQPQPAARPAQPPRAAAPATQAAAPQTPAPQAPATPATAPAQPQAETAAADDSPTTGSQAETNSEALSTLTLQRLDLGSDTGAAISLADRVRARREAAATIPAPAPAAAAGQLFEVTGNSVNLRSGPSAGDPVMGRVFAGDRVRVLETMPSGWSRIQHPETGGEVYMSSNFLRPVAN